MKPDDFFPLRFMEKHWTLEEEITPEFHVEFGPRLPNASWRLAGKLQIELIVLGVRGYTYPRVAAHLPGPTAYDVVSHARCPVLVIRGEHPLQK